MFEETLSRIEIHSLTEEEYREYESSLKSYRDRINEINTARLEGREEGLREGIKEGEMKGKWEKPKRLPNS